VAPGGKWAIHGFSSWGVPRVTDSLAVPSHTDGAATLGWPNDSLKAASRRFKQAQVEFYPGGHRRRQSARRRMMKPATSTRRRSTPSSSMYMESRGTRLSATRGGGQYSGTRWLTQQGYIVASVDRGERRPQAATGGRRRSTRIGGIRVKTERGREDHRAASVRGFSTRMGVWGGAWRSSTLLLMFRAATPTKSACQSAPVADVHNYRYDLPGAVRGLQQTDSAAYYDASADQLCRGLKGRLLVVHGHRRRTMCISRHEQLINKLVSLTSRSR